MGREVRKGSQGYLRALRFFAVKFQDNQLLAMNTTKTIRILIGIIAVSVLLRAGAAFVMGNVVEPLPGIHDQESYHMLAQRVLQGHGFTVAEDWWPMTRAGEPTAHWSYVYTLYLTAIYAVFGVQPLVARLLQVLIVGVLWPLFAFRIGRRIAGDTVGLVAAGWSAVYLYFAYYSAALMTEPFYIVGILVSLDLALSMSSATAQPLTRGRQAGQWALLGLVLGVTVLLRQLVLLVVPFVLAYVWLSQAGQRAGPGAGTFARQAARRLVYPVLAVAIIAALIAPWTVRNAFAFNRFVMLNTNAGFAFFWANHPIYGTTFVGILPDNTPYESLIPRELHSLSEAELDSALLREGLNFVVQDPWRYVQLSISRIGTYFMFWPSEDSSTLSNIVRVLSFAVALPLIVYGLVAAARRWRKWLLLYLFVVVYTAIHLLSWALIRYRLPVDAVLLVFAAYGLVNVGRKLRRTLPSARPALVQTE